MVVGVTSACVQQSSCGGGAFPLLARCDSFAALSIFVN